MQEGRIKRSLTITNPERDVARREHVRGWDQIPKTIELWRESEDGLIIPRGLGDQLEVMLGTDDVEWVDNRVDVPISTSLWRNPIMRPYQEPAVVAMKNMEQGIYKTAPAGGKTVVVLEAIRRIGRRAVVVVNNVHLAAQWRQRAQEHLGIEAGLIGDGVWEEADLTIAIQQTLWARRDSLDGWWETWGLSCWDECHHAPADTFFDIIQRFPSRWRLGVSATPNKAKGFEHLVRVGIGPVIHETPDSELVKSGVILRPEVIVVPTEFDYPFWPTHRAKKVEGVVTCEFKDRGCDRRGPTHRNNYSSLTKELVNDPGRNDIIADRIVWALNEDRAVLVLSGQLGHLDNLASRCVALIGNNDDIFRLSGKEKADERMELYERADEGHLAIFATQVGDEGMDIPRLDTLVLAFPTRNEDLLAQRVGRIARTHPRKKRPIVFDFRDLASVLQNQLRARERYYKRKKLTLVEADQHA